MWANWETGALAQGWGREAIWRGLRAGKELALQQARGGAGRHCWGHSQGPREDGPVASVPAAGPRPSPAMPQPLAEAWFREQPGPPRPGPVHWPLAPRASLQPSPAVPLGRFRFVFTSQDCVLLLLPVLWAVSRVLSSRVSILLELPSESEGTFWFVPSCCKTVVPMTLAQCPARARARVCTAVVPALKLSVR